MISSLRCPHLTHLKLGGQRLLDDDTLRDCIATLPLSTLSIDGCVLVTDAGVEALSSRTSLTVRNSCLETGCTLRYRVCLPRLCGSGSMWSTAIMSPTLL
jgi:hypothetical protein